MKLIVDAPCIGLIKRYRKRLQLLGFKIIIPWCYFKDDEWLKKLAEREKAIIVTYDKDFVGYDRAIVLTQHKRYEEQITEFFKKLRGKE